MHHPWALPPVLCMGTGSNPGLPHPGVPFSMWLVGTSDLCWHHHGPGATSLALAASPASITHHLPPSSHPRHKRGHPLVNPSQHCLQPRPPQGKALQVLLCPSEPVDREGAPALLRAGWKSLKGLLRTPQNPAGIQWEACGQLLTHVNRDAVSSDSSQERFLCVFHLPSVSNECSAPFRIIIVKNTGDLYSEGGRKGLGSG